MRVGDLVRDTDVGDYGIIIATDKHKKLFKIAFFCGVEEWLTNAYLEVIQ